MPLSLRKSKAERLAARERRQREKEQRAAEQQQAFEQQWARRQVRRGERTARRDPAMVLPALGVAVRDGQIFKSDSGGLTGRDEGKFLGALTGAHAGVTAGRARHRRAGASRTGTRGTAFVVFADGTTHQKRINDQSSLVKARADTLRFNTLAAAYPEQGPEAATSTRR